MLVSVLKFWNSVHINLIIPYDKSIIQHNSGDTIINKDIRFNCIKITDLATGWFNFSEKPSFTLKEVSTRNNEYIENLYAMLSSLCLKTVSRLGYNEPFC